MAEPTANVHKEVESVLQELFPGDFSVGYSNRYGTVRVVRSIYNFFEVDVTEWKRNDRKQKKQLLKCRIVDYLRESRESLEEFISKIEGKIGVVKKEPEPTDELTRSCMNCSSYGVCKLQDDLKELGAKMSVKPFHKYLGFSGEIHTVTVERIGELETFIAKRCNMYEQKKLVP
jgi:hypothetical protein